MFVLVIKGTPLQTVTLEVMCIVVQAKWVSQENSYIALVWTFLAGVMYLRVWWWSDKILPLPYSPCGTVCFSVLQGGDLGVQSRRTELSWKQEFLPPHVSRGNLANVTADNHDGYNKVGILYCMKRTRIFFIFNSWCCMNIWFAFSYVKSLDNVFIV